MKLPALVALVLLAGPVVAAADTLDDKYQSLKDAVTSKSVPEIKKLALEIFPLVATAATAPAPEAEDAKEAWSSGVARPSPQTWAKMVSPRPARARAIHLSWEVW